MANRFTYRSGGRSIRIIVFAIVCAFLCVSADLLAQSFAPTKLKTEQGGLNRRKASEKERKRKNKGTAKRKSKLLQKSYYKKKSNQTQYPGNIWIDPRPKDFTAIKERVERNPSRARLKTQKSRKSYFRASSNRKHKSFGSDVVIRNNPKLNYQYSSRAIISNKGSTRIKLPKKNYKKSSKEIIKHKGNIFLQPEAKKRDYNEIKARVEKNPGRSMSKLWNRQKKRAISNSALTQTYRGDIHVKARKSKMQTYKYDSRTIQKSPGGLRAGSVRSAEKRRKAVSASSASFGGNIVLPAKNHKRLRSVYNSKVIQQHKGGLRRPPKVPGPQYTAKYQGDLKSSDKLGKKQWDRYNSNRQTSYSGALKSKNYKKKAAGSPAIAKNPGNIKVYSRSDQKRYAKRDSKIISNYPGNIRTNSKKRYQELQGKSLNLSEYRGNVRSYTKKGKPSFGTTYTGSIRSKTRKQRYQELQGKSLNFTGYEGGIPVLSKRKQDKWVKKNARTTGNYSGNIMLLSTKKRKQELEGKSLNLSEYRGDMKIKNRDRFGARQPVTNENIAAFRGDIVITARDRKKLQYDYRSKVQHNYTGDVKLKKYSKWLDNRKSRSNSMANFQGNIKVSNAGIKRNLFEHKSKEIGGFQGNIRMTRNDLKEKQYEHMSKSAHNFSGDRRIKATLARARYYRNISDRNQQIIGNFRIKTRLARDIEEQIASARIHNYQGGPKTSLFTRIWLNLFDKSDRLEKLDDKTRKPKYDSREYKIWY